jgi:hypothetical protein
MKINSLKGGLKYLIRNISYELLDKTHLTTNILLKFEDKGINKDFYDYIKKRLEDFKMEDTHGHSITIDSKYDYTTDILLVGIVLSIPDIHKSMDEELERIVNNLSYKFIKFYERNIQLYKTKK